MMTEIHELLDSDVRALVKSIEASFTIECVPCGNEETVTASGEWAAAKRFALGGWRIVENEAWCDECVEPGISTQATSAGRGNNDLSPDSQASQSESLP